MGHARAGIRFARRIQSGRWGARTLVGILVLVSACDDLPIPSSLNPAASSAPDSRPLRCRHQRDPGMLIFACEFRDLPDRFTEFVRGRLLPPEEALLRSRMTVRFGQRKPLGGSSIDPFSDTEHDVAGWEIYDAPTRTAMLILGINGHFGLAVTRTDTDGLDDIKRVLGGINFAEPESMLGPKR